MSFALVVLAGCGPKVPEVAPDAPFRFAVVGDRADEPSDAAWRAVMAAVEGRHPDLVLTVGDLADDALDPTDWDTALAGMAVLSAPVAHTPGNHDILDQATAEVFQERTGQAPYRSFDQGGVHFVVLDNSIAESWDALPEEQRAWLAADLADHAGQLVVVSMHKPFWALAVAAGKPDPMHDLFVAHGVRAVFTGHWHAHTHQRIDGIDYVGVGTSGGAYGGLQDVRRGNAYEFAWVEAQGGALTIGMVADGAELPVDYVTLADNQRLRALRMGAVSAIARDGQIDVAIENLHDAPIEGVLTIEPGTWTVESLEIPLSVAPGATFTHTVAATPGASPFPSPRIRLDYPLPHAGVVPYEAPVDVVREVNVPRGSATVDGALGEWDGSAGMDVLTTAHGVPTRAEPTTVWFRHDDEALYVAFRCAESDPAALQRHHQGRDGQVVFDDRVGLLLFPTPDQLVWFYVNPNGAVWDVRRAGGVVDRGWDGIEAAASVDAAGWSVEARIPVAALELAEVPATWAFDLRRRQERTQAEATFTPGFGSRDPARIGVLRLDGAVTRAPDGGATQPR